MTRRRVLWDSACCLAFLKGEADRVDLCEEVLDQAKAGKVEIVLSALALAETLNLSGAASIPKASRETVRKFFARSSFVVADVTRRISERAQDLVWDHGVKPKDAVHVATALEYAVPVIHTFDGALIALSKRLGGVPKLQICAPGDDVEQINLKLPRSSAERGASVLKPRGKRKPRETRS